MDKSIVPAKTFVLKANIHCSGCEKKMKKLIQRVNGVHTISIDADLCKITISGTIDPQTVVKLLEASEVKSELLWEPVKEQNNLQIIDQKQQHEKTYYGIDHGKDFVEQLQQISEIKGVKSVELTRDKLKLTFKENGDDNNCKDRRQGHGANCCAKKSNGAMHGYKTNMSQDYNGNRGTCHARNSACAMLYCNEYGLPQVAPCTCTSSYANIPVGLPWPPAFSPSAPPEYYDTPPPPPSPPPPPPPVTAYWNGQYDNSFSDENPSGCTIM